jgi:hypothetical protein
MLFDYGREAAQLVEVESAHAQRDPYAKDKSA